MKTLALALALTAAAALPALAADQVTKAPPSGAYKQVSKLVSTIYMIPVEDLNPKKKFDNLKAPGGNVDHVDVYFNAGHPGVEKPHAHVVLWHVPPAGEARVAK